MSVVIRTGGSTKNWKMYNMLVFEPAASRFQIVQWQCWDLSCYQDKSGQGSVNFKLWLTASLLTGLWGLWARVSRVGTWTQSAWSPTWGQTQPFPGWLTCAAVLQSLPSCVPALPHPETHLQAACHCGTCGLSRRWSKPLFRASRTTVSIWPGHIQHLASQHWQAMLLIRISIRFLIGREFQEVLHLSWGQKCSVLPIADVSFRLKCRVAPGMKLYDQGNSNVAKPSELGRLWQLLVGSLLGASPCLSVQVQSYQIDSQVLSACFSNDGKRIASGCTDGVVRLYDVSLPAPVASIAASDRGGNNFRHL